MKLINNTRLSDSVLERVLIGAGRMVGARTGGTVVMVSAAQTAACRALAYECIAVRWGRGRKRRTTDGGAFKISLPAGDTLVSATRFFEVAAHEWCHIREYQLGGRDRFAFSTRSATGARRPRHDDRPEEMRAYDRLRVKKSEGKDANSHYEIILNLALAMEASS